MIKKPRLGIVGLGVQGSACAELIPDGMIPNIEIGAICDGNPGRRQVAESNYPAAPSYSDYLTRWASRRCSAHRTHKQLG